jgi:hypothetical protein
MSYEPSQTDQEPTEQGGLVAADRDRLLVRLTCLTLNVEHHGAPTTTLK